MKRQLFQSLVLTIGVIILSACTTAIAERGGEVFKTIKEDWNKTFGKPVEPKEVHLYNFDTFVCDGTRQIVVSFNPDGSNVSIMFNRRDKLLTRVTPLHPFTDGLYDLYIMPDGTLLVEKDFDVIFKHCKPLVNDPVIAEEMKTTDGKYDYPPTITPQEAKADMIFRDHLKK